MSLRKRRWGYRQLILLGTGILASLLVLTFIFVNLYLEPILKSRIHILIVQGSDSLYTYKLGKLKASLLGGTVEVQNLEINVDSAHYEQMRQNNILPALTMQLSLQRGYIKGIGIWALILGRRITVDELASSGAHIRLSRHPHKKELVVGKVPMWKAIQPKIKSIAIHKIDLNGIKLHYTNADSTQSVKFEFDRCDALLKDIRIDSASSVDTSRIAFTKDISLKFSGLKFRTNDSTYKMKAKWITYSSKERYFEIDSFKLQPTLDNETYYQRTGLQKDLYRVEFDKIRIVNTALDHFIRNDMIDPDSIVLERPQISIYLDKGQTPIYESKIGKYPQEQLLKASSTIMLQHLFIRQGSVDYTEKNPKTGDEGHLAISDLDIAINNITNDSGSIQRHPLCTAKASGKILGSSPLTAAFTFYLDSSNGRFDASGTVQNVGAAQLNPLAHALTNIEIQSLQMQQLNFSITGADYDATAGVKMLYNNLFLVIHKTDENTGATKTKKFATKMLNRFIIWPQNPVPGSPARTAQEIKVYRLTTESFFGLIWKAVFAGMQKIMMKE